MVSGSQETIEQQRRMAAMWGEKTSVSAVGWMRVVARVFVLFLTLLVMVPMHYTFRVFAYGSPFPMLFLRFATAIVGARVYKVGTSLRRDVFFVANHVSWVDILALSGASGTAFVAKAELSDVPIVGWLSRLNRTVFVKRENRLGVAEQINALREALDDNWSVTVFPEGTTTDGQSLLPFKTSMLSVLEPPPPGVLVQPVLIDYGSVAEWIGWVGDEGGVNNFKRILARGGTFTLTLHFLEPFSPEEFHGRKAIGAQARKQIEGALMHTLDKPLRDFEHTVPPIRYEAPEKNFPLE